MKLTFIRHAPTSYSKSGQFMGQLDVPATTEGLKTATELGKSMQQVEINHILSSPLSRALQTAKSIFPEAKIEIDDDLKERGLGLWAGMSKPDVRKGFGDAFLPSGFIDPHFTPPEGESIDSLIERVKKFIKKTQSYSESDQIVAVTHNGIIRLLRCLLENKPIEDMFVDSEPYLTPRTYIYNKNNHWQLMSL